MRFAWLQSISSSNRPRNLAYLYETAFCLFLILLAYLFRYNLSLIYPQIIYLLVLLLASNLIAGVVLLIPRVGHDLAMAIIFLNCGTITAILLYSGPHAPHLWVLFLLPIYTACVLLDGWSVAWIALGTIACNALYHFLETRVWNSATYFEISIK